MLLYHHARELLYSPFGIVQQNRIVDSDTMPFTGAYRWLEEQVGFYPLFLAVGSTNTDIAQTGYQNQFRRKKYRRGSNMVLFSFDIDMVDHVFIDSFYWDIVLNSGNKNYHLTAFETSLVLKFSWSESKWLRKARVNPGSVQMIVPYLDLRQASRVWTRNKLTQGVLSERGFRNVLIHRLNVNI